MKFVRNIVAQVLLGLGFICIMVPFYSLLHSEFRWSKAVTALVIGVIFVGAAILLMKPPRLRGRPRYWAPAVAGAICSACTLLLSIGCVMVYRTTAESAPDWLLLVMLFLAVVGIVAAIACITTAIIAAIRAEPEKSDA